MFHLFCTKLQTKHIFYCCATLNYLSITSRLSCSISLSIPSSSPLESPPIEESKSLSPLSRQESTACYKDRQFASLLVNFAVVLT